MSSTLDRIRELGGEVTFKVRENGTHYLSTSNMIEVGGDGFLSSPTQSGVSQEEAIEQWWWAHVTDLREGQYLVVHANPGRARRHFLWLGRWTELAIPVPMRPE